jgi:hypothetical protein
VSNYIKQDRKRLRQAILAQLGRQQMTFEELADELDHISARNIIRRELLRMVGQDLICSIETKGKYDVFETWERAIERVKAKNTGPRHFVRSRIRRGERVG